VASKKSLPLLAAFAAAAFLSGCASSLPGGAAPGVEPRAAEPVAPSVADAQPLVDGASDSLASDPGSDTALYRYRFTQVLPGSERFTFQDRDLSFYFRPSPNALYFQVENRQNRPVWIDWDRSVFHDPREGTGQVAHSTTRWADRFNVQAPTQITGLQRYSDYALPMDYLVDPAGSDQQLHRPLLPEDTTAPQFSDKEFGVDLVFRIEDQPRTYSFRFKIASVIPK
jgi:hypothetical protein